MTAAQKWTAIGFLIAFGAVAAWKYGGRVLDAADDTGDSERKQEIAAFWEAYHEATRLRVAGDYDAAADLYRKAVVKRPNHEESWYYLGNCLFELGESEAAAEIYRRLLEINPRSLRAHSQLGVTLSDWTPGQPVDLVEAKQAFERSLELDPEDTGTWLRLGMLELRNGLLDDALNHFQKAAGSASAEGMFRAGYVHFLRGSRAEAEAQFARVLETEAFERKLANRGARVEGDTATPQNQTPAHNAQAAAPPPAAAWAPLREAATLAQFFSGRLEAGAAGLSPDGKLRRSLDWLKGLPDGTKGALLQIRAAGQGPTDAEHAAWADLDGDGAPDLVYIRAGEIQARLHRHGSLGRPQSFAVLGQESELLVTGDLDGDGLTDLLVYPAPGSGSAGFRWFRNLGPAGESVRFADGPPLAGHGAGWRVLDALLVDLDGDGRPELVEGGGARSGESAVRVHRAGGERWERIALAGPVVGTVLRLYAGDLDQDGHPDLLAIRWRRPPVVLWNDGSGGFQADVGDWAPVGAMEAPAAALLDFDGDGRLDIVLGRRSGYAPAVAGLTSAEPAPSGQGLLWLRNRGGRQFEDAEITGPGHGVLDLAVADVDGDQRPDLLVMSGDLGAGAARLEPGRILLNQGDGKFRPDAVLPPVTPGTSGPRMAGPVGLGRSSLLHYPGAGLLSVTPPGAVPPGPSSGS